MLPLLSADTIASFAVSVTALLGATLVPLVGDGAVQPRNGSTQAVATAVFGTWVWPFELLSVLLLAALVGAFALARIAGLFTKDGASELGLDRLVAALGALETPKDQPSESRIQVAAPKPPPGSQVRPVEPSGRAF